MRRQDAVREPHTSEYSRDNLQELMIEEELTRREQMIDPDESD
jgi:hypothetical protein